MSVFTGKKLMRKSKEEVDAEEALKDMEVVLVYFSAHWCPPCRGFTPLLKDFYGALEGKKLAILFVSSDRTEGDMESYWNDDHGDWYAVPFGSELGNTLKKNCSVSGIPMLCVVSKEGKCLYGEARGDVQAGPPTKALKKFKEIDNKA